VVARNDIHSNTILPQSLKEHHAVGLQRLKVYELAIFIIISEMDDLLDSILVAVWEEYLFIEASLVLDKDFGRVAHARVRII
jgi:hypothetical protein